MTINGVNVGTVFIMASRYYENLGLVLECRSTEFDDPFRLLVDKYQIIRKIDEISKRDHRENITPDFSEELKKHPELADILIRIYTHYMEAVKGIREVNTKYKVPDWTWEFDDSDEFIDFQKFEANPSVENVGISLRYDRFLDNIITQNDEYINKLIECNNGNHQFVKIGEGIEWCSVCGTIKYIDENGNETIRTCESNDH